MYGGAPIFFTAVVSGVAPAVRCVGYIPGPLARDKGDLGAACQIAERREVSHTIVGRPRMSHVSRNAAVIAVVSFPRDFLVCG